MNKIEWKLKEDYEVVGTSEMYYDLFDGGYIDPENFLDDEEQIKKINDAIKTVESYLKFLEDNGAIEIL